MDRLAIIGGRELYGEVEIAGAKNSALKVMVAALLTDEALRLDQVPDLADVRQLTTLLRNHGASVERDGSCTSGQRKRSLPTATMLPSMLRTPLT